MTLGDLKTEVAAYLHRTDLDDRITFWAQLAGRRIDGDARLPEMEYRATADGTNTFIPLPADYITMRNLQTGTGEVLEYVTPEQLDRLRYANITSGFYTIMDGQLEVLNTPDSANPLPLEIFYFARNPLLSADADTNKVITAYPQLYLYATLMEAALFLVDDAAVQRWTSLYTAEVQMRNEQAQQGRFGGNALTMRSL